MKMIILTIMLLFTTTAVFANRLGIEGPFKAAGDFYRQGDYKNAIQEYESILSRDSESGAVYYNLANSYFKDGQLGKAILNYERAKRLIPRDGDLGANYKFVLSQVRNYSSDLEPAWKVWLKQLIQSVTEGEYIIALMILYLLTGLVHLSRFFVAGSRKNIMLLCAGLSCVLLILTAAFVYKINDDNKTAIILKDTDARFEPRENATAHFKLSEGTPVAIQEKEGAWVKISRFDGKLGWVESQAIENIAR
ncbi:MAG: hypothetical protein A2Z88_10085 [Omnitrophica WOR_2 bacterium GWA2_47_8]|nr:MAG: hypothetical protein A2Z88_10085 [Omnitrophica WOR_2 bacterium GWA2_47_8]